MVLKKTLFKSTEVNTYSITFFSEYNFLDLTKHLISIGYELNKDRLVYGLDGNEKKLEIKAFNSNLDSVYGYILSYTDDCEGLIKILHYTFSSIHINIVNCEFKVVTGKSQSENIKCAESLDTLSRGSMYGIYHCKNELGILCMPDDTVIFQQRVNKPTLQKMNSHLREFHEKAQWFTPQDHSLFNGIFSF